MEKRIINGSSAYDDIIKRAQELTLLTEKTQAPPPAEKAPEDPLKIAEQLKLAAEEMCAEEEDAKKEDTPPEQKEEGTKPADELPPEEKTAEEGQLGDGKSDSPTQHAPENAGDTPPTYNSNQEEESKKVWGLSSNIKAAVLARVEVVDEKTAALQGAGKKAISIMLPLAALMGGGAGGYAVGKNADRKEDRRTNSKYYQAGVYDAAKALVRHMEAQTGGGDGK